MTQKKITGRIILLFLFVLLTGCELSPGGKEIKEIKTDTSSEEVILENNRGTEDEQIWVHICGQVMEPGVYSFSKESRVFDAIEAAGGFTDQADQESVNLALTLTDEGKIYVPALGETNEEQDSGNQESDGKINLNKATLEELMSLPGIGEKRAQAILKLREERGGFSKIEDLLEAEGIKEGIFEQIKEFITV